MSFNIPPQATCEVSYEFQKNFLHFTEYPPDASNGIHAPGPVLTLIPSIESQLQVTYSFIPINVFRRGSKVRIYGEPSIVLLPTPDFSMPFNVICFVCTIVALIFQRFLTFTTQ
jgi:phosphatidylinositol glycan class T